jgi:hypothetical protein
LHLTRDPNTEKAALGCGATIIVIWILVASGGFGTILDMLKAGNSTSDISIQNGNPVTTPPISNISWGAINAIYNLKSTYTDLQKDQEWQVFKGKRVRWSGSVEAIADSFGSLTMQVKMNPDTFTSDVIITLRESERSKAAQLHQGDSVTFTATLDRWGTLVPLSMDDGVIGDD